MGTITTKRKHISPVVGKLEMNTAQVKVSVHVVTVVLSVFGNRASMTVKPMVLAAANAHSRQGAMMYRQLRS